MNTQLSLTLDFGIVGHHYLREPFCVRLDASALEQLISDARNAWRVYELTLINRPGDVWDYVHVRGLPCPRTSRARVGGCVECVECVLLDS